MPRVAAILGEQGLPAAAAISIFGQAIALGANSIQLAAIASLANLVLAVLALVGSGRSAGPAFWRALLWPAIPFAFALAWGAMPLLGLPGMAMPGAGPVPVTTDGLVLELCKLVGVGSIFLAGALIASDARRQRAMQNWLIYGSAVYFPVSVAIWSYNPYSVFGANTGYHSARFTATLLNANVTACFMGALVVIAAGRVATGAVRPRLLVRDPWRVARLAVALLVAAAGIWLIVRTASRTGLVGVGTGLAILLVLMPRQSGRSFRWGPVVAAVGLVALVYLSLESGAAATFDRPIVSEDTHTRLAAYQLAWPMIQSAPVFGHGLGAFRQLHQHALTLADAGDLWNLGAVHDALLQTVLEGGFPFAAFIVLAILTAGLPVAAHFTGAISGRRWALSLTGALAAIVIDSAGDIALNAPVVASLFCLLLGLLWGWAHGEADVAATPALKTSVASGQVRFRGLRAQRRARR